MNDKQAQEAGYYRCVSWACPRAVGVGKTKEQAYEAWIVNAQMRKVREDMMLEQAGSYFHNPLEKINKADTKESIIQRIKRWFE